MYTISIWDSETPRISLPNTQDGGNQVEVEEEPRESAKFTNDINLYPQPKGRDQSSMPERWVHNLIDHLAKQMKENHVLNLPEDLLSFKGIVANMVGAQKLILSYIQQSEDHGDLRS